MKCLLVDIGNSRCKWAVLQDARLGPMRAVHMAGASPASLASALHASCDADAVLAVNVAGPRGAALLREALRRLAMPAPQFIRSAARQGGVRNAYGEPWRLGADRWAALLGARHLAPRRAVCVASVGTALTLDVLDRHGRHRGGLIVPGPELMRRSLLEQTSGIRRRAGALRARRPVRGFLARDTAAALTLGPQQACAALIDATVQRARLQQGVTPLLFLTGGGAAAVAAALRTRYRLQADLVLQGLAVLA